jgi:hypothetical protein
MEVTEDSFGESLETLSAVESQSWVSFYRAIGPSQWISLEGAVVCLPLPYFSMALFFVIFFSLYILMKQIQNNQKSIEKSIPANGFL